MAIVDELCSAVVEKWPGASPRCHRSMLVLQASMLIKSWHDQQYHGWSFIELTHTLAVQAP